MGGTPFLRVSSRPCRCALGRDQEQRSTSQRESACLTSQPSSKRPRLSLRNCPICLDPARVSAVLLQFPSSQHVQGLGNLVTSSLPECQHMLVAVIHALHAHWHLANIPPINTHMPAEQLPRPSRCLSTSRPSSTSGERCSDCPR